MRDHRQPGGACTRSSGLLGGRSRGVPALHMMLHTVGPGHPAASYPWQVLSCGPRVLAAQGSDVKAGVGHSCPLQSPWWAGPAAPQPRVSGRSRGAWWRERGSGTACVPAQPGWRRRGGNKSCAEAEQRELGWWGGAGTERRWRCGAGLLPGWHSECALLTPRRLISMNAVMAAPPPAPACGGGVHSRICSQAAWLLSPGGRPMAASRRG